MVILLSCFLLNYTSMEKPEEWTKIKKLNNAWIECPAIPPLDDCGHPIVDLNDILIKSNYSVSSVAQYYDIGIAVCLFKSLEIHEDRTFRSAFRYLFTVWFFLFRCKKAAPAVNYCACRRNSVALQFAIGCVRYLIRKCVFIHCKHNVTCCLFWWQKNKNQFTIHRFTKCQYPYRLHESNNY